eukprot:6172395-Pleurochrysis_carterae.AAC.1
MKGLEKKNEGGGKEERRGWRRRTKGVEKKNKGGGKADAAPNHARAQMQHSAYAHARQQRRRRVCCSNVGGETQSETRQSSLVRIL